jgi:hypothetical protein
MSKHKVVCFGGDNVQHSIEVKARHFGLAVDAVSSACPALTISPESLKEAEDARRAEMERLQRVDQ